MRGLSRTVFFDRLTQALERDVGSGEGYQISVTRNGVLGLRLCQADILLKALKELEWRPIEEYEGYHRVLVCGYLPDRPDHRVGPYAAFRDVGDTWRLSGKRTPKLHFDPTHFCEAPELPR